MPRKKKEENIEQEKESAEVAVEVKEERVEVIGEKPKRSRKKKDEKTEEKKEEKKEDKAEKEIKEKTEGLALVTLDDYVKSGIHLGTRVVSPHMRKYMYRRRADGLAVLNTKLIDEKLKDAAKFLAQFPPEEIVVACKRQAGWEAAKLFSEVTGIKVFTKKYPAGVLTNTNLPTFFEATCMVICDPWVDKNALKDSNRVKMKVMGLCDTNNLTTGIEVIVPCNNKSNKSLGLVFWILAREYLKARGIDKKLPSIEEFAGQEVVEETTKKPDISDDVRKIEERMRFRDDDEER
ncbi:hypothetical protein COV15_00900 [Candidatus Woesearchaeota archaeon CG10_big_fil_rev_8_21_14_0_10_34_12]|nr:MAG: hypothetical protein COV15_00900 [Candidatus Woesearchaeota archaeon CG10_big_fil_rev_8_21_14_0_10_34_12]